MLVEIRRPRLPQQHAITITTIIWYERFSSIRFGAPSHMSGAEMTVGLYKLGSEPVALVNLLQRLDEVIDMHLQPFTISAARYRYISHGDAELILLCTRRS